MRSLAHATQLGGSIDHGERHLRVPTSEPARAGNVDRSTDEAVEFEQQRALLGAVSYTHLTLPTIYSV